METPETTESTSPSILDRARSLSASLVERVTAAKDSGAQMITDRRGDRRRDALLRELGALHFAVAGGEDLDLPEVERIVAELAELDAAASSEGDDDAVE